MAMLQCEIVTPVKVLFSGQASMVEAPSTEGSFGIMAGHEAFSCLIESGVARVAQDEERSKFEDFVVGHGFAQVCNDKVTILVSNGVARDDIDVAEVKERLAALKQRYDAMSDDEKERARIADALSKGADVDAVISTEDQAAHAKVDTIMSEMGWCEDMLAAARK